MDNAEVTERKVAQGDLPGALKSSRDSLAVFEELAMRDTGNAGLQRDFSDRTSSPF